jgi:hypothetical protein
MVGFPTLTNLARGRETRGLPGTWCYRRGSGAPGMMPRILRDEVPPVLTLIPVLLIAASAGAMPPPTDLESWRSLGAASWRHDTDGVAAGPSDRTGFLVSPEKHGDFVLSVEFWIDAQTNSGVFIRCGAVEMPEQLNPFDCYEVNIFDQHPQQENRTGAVVFVVPPDARVDTTGRWNRLEIRAQGQNIEIRVNGTRTATLDDARTGPGPVALQYGGSGIVRFRSLRIDDEPKAPD